MGYRGDDLDIRTPAGWGAGREHDVTGAPNWWTRSTIYSGGRADPIWADDIVLGCFNHAYDLAAAHRAGEVRLEHLLHALTLDEAAASVLEHRGVRTAGLRRETATAIAEMPASGHNGRGGPRKSEEVEDVLRHAADRAYPRGTPVTVDDLLHAMFEAKRNSPGLAVLYRHGANWSPRDERPEVRLEPLPHLIQHPAQGEFRFPPSDELRARAAQSYFGDTRERGVVAERAKTSDDMVQQRPREGAVVAATIVERLVGIEHAMETFERSFATILERISGLERQLAERQDSIEQRPIDLTPVDERIASLERNMLARIPQGSDLASVTELLSGIETRTDDTVRSTTEIGERLVRLERSMDNRAAETGRTVSFVGERLRAFEEQLTLQNQQGASLKQAIDERLQAMANVAQASTDELTRVSAALETVTANQRTLASAFDQWRLDAGGDLGVIDNRVQGLEAASKAMQPQIEALASQVAVVHAVLAKREARKSQWRNWLFGTDDWYAASWNTERWRQAQSALDEADARLERSRTKPVGNVPVRR
jgi:uncharacterized protein YicC (UPF0701 family)